MFFDKQVSEIKKELGDQISLEFRESFSQNGSLNVNQMTQACLVLDVLDPHIKHDLLQWFVQTQLQEYTVLYEENEESAWLDKVRRSGLLFGSEAFVNYYVLIDRQTVRLVEKALDAIRRKIWGRFPTSLGSFSKNCYPVLSSDSR